MYFIFVLKGKTPFLKGIDTANVMYAWDMKIFNILKEIILLETVYL